MPALADFPRHAPEKLGALLRRLLEAAGSAPPEAAMVAEHLVGAHLAGHDSHGSHLMARYLDDIRMGRTRPNTPARLAEDLGALLRFDGGFGFGQRVAREATEQAIARARTTGLVLYTVTAAMHVGRIGAYGEQAVAAGLAAILFVNVIGHEPCVAPHGGIAARLLTNPVCIALPWGGSGGRPFLLDMATSQIALGKVNVANAGGYQIPPGTAIDPRGRPTRNPADVVGEPAGALLPAGLHKGYGLAVACELLAGAFGGGGTIQPGTLRDGTTRNNLFGILFDPARLGDPAAQRAEAEALAAYLLATEAAAESGPVRLAGDPEHATGEERRRLGIPLAPATLEALLASGESLGLARAGLLALLEP